MKPFDARLVCQRLCLLTNKGQAGKRQRERAFSEEVQARAWKIWTQSVRRNRISYPLMNFLAVFIVFFFPHVAVIRWNDGHIAAGGLQGWQGTALDMPESQVSFLI